MCQLALGSCLPTVLGEEKKVAALTASQIASLLRQQGVAPEKIPTMTAISLAESGGNPKAFNPNARTGDKSYGLWQVNMLGGLGPERMKQFGLSKEEELFDPSVNARAAKKILESQGLKAWSVYKGGQYKQYLSEAQKAAASLGQQPQQTQQTQSPQDQKRIINNYFIGGVPAQDPYGFLRGYTGKMNESNRLTLQDLMGLQKPSSPTDQLMSILAQTPNYLEDPYQA